MVRDASGFDVTRRRRGYLRLNEHREKRRAKVAARSGRNGGVGL